MINFHILIVSSGRKSLKPLLNQLKKTIDKNDKVTVVLDGVKFNTKGYNKFEFISEKEVHGFWGHSLRTKYQNQLDCDYIINFDDDDMFVDGWREMAEGEIIKTDYPDMITFPYIIKEKDKISHYIVGRGWERVTGNTIVKNKEEYNLLPWGEYRGADAVRYGKISRRGRAVNSNEKIMIKSIC